MDFFPTITEMAGIKNNDSTEIDGISLCSELNGGKTPERETLYWHYPHYHSSGWTPGAAIRSGNYKLIEFYDLETTELYDLVKDPGETLNLADSLPGIVLEMTNKLYKMQEEHGALFPENNF
jgi:arylsulfatase A-like enzyme